MESTTKDANNSSQLSREQLLEYIKKQKIQIKKLQEQISNSNSNSSNVISTDNNNNDNRDREEVDVIQNLKNELEAAKTKINKFNVLVKSKMKEIDSLKKQLNEINASKSSSSSSSSSVTQPNVDSNAETGVEDFSLEAMESFGMSLVKDFSSIFSTTSASSNAPLSSDNHSDGSNNNDINEIKKKLIESNESLESMKGKLLDHSQTIQLLKEENDSVKLQLTSEMKELSENYKKQLSDLYAELSDANNINKTQKQTAEEQEVFLRKEIDCLKSRAAEEEVKSSSRIQSIAVELEESRRIVAERDASSLHLSSQVASLKSDLVSLTKTLEESDDVIAKLKERASASSSTSSKELDDAKSKIKQLQADFESEKIANAKLTGDIKSISSSLKAAEENIVTSAKALKEKEDELKQLAEAAQSGSSHQETGTSPTANPGSSKGNKKKKKGIVVADEKVDPLSSSSPPLTDILTNKVQDLEATVVALRGELEAESSKGLALRGELEAESSKGLSLKKENDQLIQAVESSCAENIKNLKTWEEKLKGLETKLESSRKEADKLKAELSTAHASSSSLQEDLISAKASVTSLESTLSTAQASSSLLKADLSSSKALVASLQADLSASRAQYESLLADKARVESELASVSDKGSDSLTRLQQKKDELEGCVEELKMTVASLEALRAKDSDSLASLEQKKDELQEQVSKLQEHVSSSTKKLKGCEEDAAQAREERELFRRKLLHFEGLVEESKETIDRYQQEVHSLTVDVQKSDILIKGLKETIATNEGLIVTLSDEKRRRVEQEQEQEQGQRDNMMMRLSELEAYKESIESQLKSEKVESEASIKALTDKVQRLKVLLTKTKNAAEEREAELLKLSKVTARYKRFGIHASLSLPSLYEGGGGGTVVKEKEKWCLVYEDGGPGGKQRKDGGLKWVKATLASQWITEGSTLIGAWPKSLEETWQHEVDDVRKGLEAERDALQSQLDETSKGFQAYKIRAADALKRLGSEERSERQKAQQSEAIQLDGLHETITKLECRCRDLEEQLQLQTSKSLAVDAEVETLKGAASSSAELLIEERERAKTTQETAKSLEEEVTRLQTALKVLSSERERERERER